MATFGSRLRELRSQKDLTQDELAARIGLGKQAISQYERGIRHPDFETLGVFCDFFNVSTDYMIGKSDITIRLLGADDLKKLDMVRAIPKDDDELLSAYHAANLKEKNIVRAVLNLPPIENIPACMESIG